MRQAVTEKATGWPLLFLTFSFGREIVGWCFVGVVFHISARRLKVIRVFLVNQFALKARILCNRLYNFLHIRSLQYKYWN